MSYKILNTIGAQCASEAKKILEEFGDVHYHIPTQDELSRMIAVYDACMVGLGLSFTREVIDAAPRLRVIATATTGLDHIDVSYAESKGIKVLSLRGENEFLDTITGTAELSLGLMIDLMRMKSWAFEEVKNYIWDREHFRGRSLYGKTLGIVGLGRLGKMMARYGKALNMRVLFADPVVEHDDHEKVPLEVLLAESDVVSVHVHLLPETENLIDAKALSLMKPNAVLINTSRGKIVDESAVLEALKSGNLGGYATDVLSDELLFEKEGFKSHPLVEYAKKNRNLIIVPHIGGMTVDSRIATDVFIAQKLARFLRTG